MDIVLHLGETASPIEIFWVAVSLIAEAGHLYAARDAYIDLRSLRYSGNRSIALAFSAQGYLVLSLLLATVQLLYIVPGVIGLISLPDQNTEVNAYNVIAAVTFVSAEILLAFISVGGVWFRHYLRFLGDIEAIS